MPGVFFSSQTNSTFFTTCCRVAICDDQAQCPVCKADVLPRSHEGRWNAAMLALYGRKRLDAMRAGYQKA